MLPRGVVIARTRQPSLEDGGDLIILLFPSLNASKVFAALFTPDRTWNRVEGLRNMDQCPLEDAGLADEMTEGRGRRCVSVD